jgi:hypothetical protein
MVVCRIRAVPFAYLFYGDIREKESTPPLKGLSSIKVLDDDLSDLHGLASPGSILLNPHVLSIFEV